MSVDIGRAETATGCEKMQSPSRTSPSKQKKKAESSAAAETKDKDKDGAVSVVYAGGIAGCLFAIPYTPSWIAVSIFRKYEIHFFKKIFCALFEESFFL